MTASHALERIARDVHELAFDFAEPARDRREAEARIARVEDLAAALRAVVRGSAQPVAGMTRPFHGALDTIGEVR